MASREIVLKAHLSLSPPAAKAPVLRDVAFTLRRGETTAVLGLSGSGKSVLLQLVAGRLDLNDFGFNGTIVNPAQPGAPGEVCRDDAGAAEATLRQLAPRVSYVPPDDVVFGFDTAREAIVFRHRLAFGSDHETASCVAAKLVDDLGLEACADNLIAPGVGLRGISGGQRRRTCIAMALATRPDILVLDEPTTGLDSTTAKHVMATVQAIAQRYDCAVLQSLQQPGSDLFPHFDSLIMLRADGSLEFSGPTLEGPSSVPKAHAARLQPSALLGKQAGDESPQDDRQDTAQNAANPVTVFAIVLARHFRALMRNPLALLMRAIQAVVLGVFFGFVFFDMDLTVDNFKQVLGFLMTIVSASFVPVQTGAAVFPMEKAVFLEEQKLPFRYPAAVYALSKTLVESLCAFPLAVVYAGAMGGLVGLPGANVGHLIVTAIFLGAAAEGFGFFVSTIAPPAISVGVLIPTTCFTMMVVGTSLASGQGATEEVFDAFKYLAFLRNGYAAAAVDVIPLVTGPCSRPGFCFFPDAAHAMRFYDLDTTSLGQEWGLLITWAVLFRAGSAIALTVMGWRQSVTYDPTRHRRAEVSVEACSPSTIAVTVGTDTVKTETSVNMNAWSAIDAEHPVHRSVQYRPQPAPVELRWDVQFSVRPRFGDGSNDFRPILRRMAGQALPGRCLAIMGGSGAGKSTLLEALSLRLPATNLFTATQRVCTIDIVCNSSTHRHVGAAARSLIAFVHQDPEFVDGLEVEEVLRFAADTSLPGGDDPAHLVEALMRQLGLTHVATTQAAKLSGSQRKRLAVGCALAMRRPIVMLDEPTSGLDPESALQLLRLLQHLAAMHGITVLYTLHQPGDELLPFISDLLLLSAGRVVYHGPLEEAAQGVFAAYPRPAGLNATDHYLELSQDLEASAALCDSWDAAHSMCERDAFPSKTEPVEECATGGSLGATQLMDVHAGLRDNVVGFAALVRRSFVATVTRVSPLTLILRFIALYLLVPIVVGVAMFDQADNVISVQNACFIVVMSFSFASTLVPIMDLHAERIVFLREQEADQYSAVAYYAARSLAALPLEVIGLCCSSLVMYFLVGFRHDAGSFFIFVAVSFLQQQSAIGLGYLLGVLIHSLAVSAALATLVQVVFATGCGVIISPMSIDDTRWLHTVEFTSPSRQAMLLLLRNELRHRPMGEQLIELVLGFDRSFDKPEALWPMLVGLSLGLRLLAGLCFKFTTRPRSY